MLSIAEYRHQAIQLKEMIATIDENQGKSVDAKIEPILKTINLD